MPATPGAQDGAAGKRARQAAHQRDEHGEPAHAHAAGVEENHEQVEPEPHAGVEQQGLDRIAENQPTEEQGAQATGEHEDVEPRAAS